jgi:6-pyruvoyl-tetrahydropterin synthase
MAIRVKSTKTFQNLPCAHGQYFDMTPGGEPGHCASLHGYDREVTLTFSGEIDEHGWIYPFGDLKEVKNFLEYYFDHVTVLAADDPRLESIPEQMLMPGGILGTLRVLPYGVSMEMSALFAWEMINPYIYHTSGGRVFLEKVEFREHDRNSAFIEVDQETAVNQANKFKSTANFMELNPVWNFVAPKVAKKNLENS